MTALGDKDFNTRGCLAVNAGARQSRAQLNIAHKWLDGVSVVSAIFSRGFWVKKSSLSKNKVVIYAYPGLLFLFALHGRQL